MKETSCYVPPADPDSVRVSVSVYVPRLNRTMKYDYQLDPAHMAPEFGPLPDPTYHSEPFYAMHLRREMSEKRRDRVKVVATMVAAALLDALGRQDDRRA